MCHHYIVNWIYEVINFRFNYLEMSALVSSSTAAHVTGLPACAISISIWAVVWSYPIGAVNTISSAITINK